MHVWRWRSPHGVAKGQRRPPCLASGAGPWEVELGWRRRVDDQNSYHCTMHGLRTDDSGRECEKRLPNFFNRGETRASKLQSVEF